MQYDFKIITFGNGDVEVRLYDAPIYELTDEEKEKRNKKRLSTIERRKEENECLADDMSEYYETLGGDFIPMGFEGDFQLLKTREEFLDGLEEIRKRKNTKDSRRRTLNAVHDIARSEKWTMFYTLTFSPEVVDRTDFEACMKKANKWFNNLRRKAKDLKYMFVPELHADGVSWHIHGLVCNDKGVEYVDSGRTDKRGRSIYNIGNWRYGFSTATCVTDTRCASSYILKYITKELCEFSFGCKRYYHSQNVNKPIVQELSREIDFGVTLDYGKQEEFVNTLLNSIGACGVLRKERVVSEHCSVTYINSHIEESEEMEIERN